MKLKKIFSKKVVILIVSLLAIFSCRRPIVNFFTSFKMSTSAYNNMYRIKSDPNTMDSYQTSLIDEKNGSRYAGRVWADKTVLANGNSNTLLLDMNTDGIDKEIKFNDDFLHVYSALGSTIIEKTEEPVPVDVVFIIDMSGSMGIDVVDKASHNDSATRIAHSRIQQVITSINNSIEYLMNKGEENRIAVVVYGGTASTLMELGHYKKNGSSPYITVSDFTAYAESSGFSKSGGCAYTLKVNAIKDGVSVTRTVRNNYAKDIAQSKKNSLNAMIGFSTNLQAGIYQGFNELYKNMNDVSDVTYTYTSKLTNEKVTVPRVPVAVVMSDGATNYGLKRNDSNASIGDEWYNVPVLANMNDYLGNQKLYRTETNEIGRGGKETILEILLTAGFMKAKVSKQYNNLIEQANIDRSKYNIKFNVVTVSVDTPEDISGSNWQVPRLYATLNPEKYFKKDLSGVNWAFKQDAVDAYTLYEQWLAAPEYITSTLHDSDFSTEGAKTIRINKIIGDVNGVTNDDVVANINYTDSFDDITSGEVDSFFEKIITNITNTTFMPVGGSNDHGIGNSITYMDPIGKYAEIKQNGLKIDGNNYDMSLLLFGKMHNMQKAAMYSYTFNQSHDNKTGWYNSSGDFLGTSGNWSNGDIYYLSNEDVKKAIPTLIGEKEITNQQKNTVYTIYGFVGENADEEQPNLSYDNSDVKYKLNDIRVWTEDTGNYVDEDNPIASELGYDNALYVNIPITALPLQSVVVEINRDGKITSYKSNIEEKNKSTPIRLFYSVGIADSILTEDKLDIDLAKVSPEYLSANKKNDTVYFYSNYYSNTNYDGYVTDTRAERTRGDANVTFSPDKSNRYYAFQRSLTLYEVTADDQKNENGFYNEINIEDESAYENFKEKHIAVSSSDKIKEDSWYYIVIDYYLPNKNTIMRTAVPREGKEFGIGKDSINVNVENQLCWYNNSTGESKTFTLNSNKPTDGDDWVIATKPGGIRVGDMAQNLKPKSSNITETAANYIIPIIGSNTDDKIVIDAFLGNNGRIEVDDSLLLIAKDVKTDSLGEKTINKDREFEFTLKIDGREGDYQAIKAHRNPYSNAWQLRVNTIDLLTNNEGFLQNTDNKPYVYSKDGKEYYIYIGENTVDTGDKYVFRVYSAIDGDNHVNLKKSGMTTYVEDAEAIDKSLKSEKNKYKNVDSKNTLGSIDFWIDKVYLIPVETVNGGNWNKQTSGYTSIDEFVVAHLDSMKEGANELSSNYATETAYLTTEIKFGYSASNKPGSKPKNWTSEEWDAQEQNVAKFKLKADEGILLSGLKASTNYKVTENITEKDNIDRYYFDHIDINDEASAKTADKTVTGVVTANYIDEVVYTNIYYAPVSLSISKVVDGALASKDKEWEFNVKLTPSEGMVLGEEYDYTTENIEGVDQKLPGKIHLDLQEDGSYTGTVSLKHGQTVTITGLPEGTEYSVSEKEANLDGYTTKITGETEGTLNLKNPSSAIKFRNIKLSSHNLSISKVIEGELAEKDKEWTFEITLTTSDDITLEESYKYTGSKEGNIKFTNKEGNTYVGEIKLKAGETITIEKLPERTEYVVAEKESNKEGYKTYSEKETGILKDKEEEQVKFTNVKYSLHDLTIEKNVTGGAGDKEKAWEFEVTFTPEDDVRFDMTYPTIGGSNIDGVDKPEDGELKLSKDGKSYKGTITLKHGQKITIKNIPERTEYNIVEKEADTNEYKTTIKGNRDGTLTKAEETVTFTNRKLSKHNLSISKIVDGALADKEKNWTFKITLTPGEDVELLKSYTYNGSKEGTLSLALEGEIYSGTITLKSGEEVTIHDLPEGTKYKVEEQEANTEGYTTKVTGKSEGTLNLENNAPRVEFKNIKLSKHSLTISKEVIGGAGNQNKEWNFVVILTPKNDVTLDDSYPVITGSISSTIPSVSIEEVTLKHQEDGTSVIEFKLKHGQSITINNLPEGTNYEVKEKEANTDEYITKTEENNKGTLGSNKSESVKFINKKPSKHDLSITKKVTGGLGDKDKLWTFHIFLTPDEDVTLLNEYSVEGIENKTITLERQLDGRYKGTIKLKSGETATIKSLPENTKYKVEEEEANTEGYVTTVKESAEGSLDGKNKTVEFTNTKLASYNLIVRKNVYGNLGDKDKTWNFKIKLYAPKIKDLSASYSYEKIKIEETSNKQIESGTITLNKVDGHYEFDITLKDNEQITIKDLLEDTKYEIIEQEANMDDYETTIEGSANGTLNSETSIIIFKNAKYSKHDLKLNGRLKGNDVESNKDWTIDVTIKPDSNANMKDSYVWEDENGEEHQLELTPNEDGSYSGKLTLKGNGSGTIKDLPYGSEFEIEIEEANKDGYKTTIDGNKGLLAEDETIIQFTNERNITLPSTLDNIIHYFIIFIVSLLVIVCEGIYFKVKK